MEKPLNKHIKHLVLISLGLLLTTLACTQPCSQPKIDSLLLELSSNGNTDYEKIDNWNSLSKCYLYTDLDSAKYYANKANVESEKKGYFKGLAKSTQFLARAENKGGNPEKALELLVQSVGYYQKTEKDIDFLYALNLIGYIYDLRHDYDNAINYYFQGLNEAESLGFQLDVAFFLNNLSTIYSKVGNTDKQETYIKKASKIFKALGEDRYYAYSLVNIGMLYESLNAFDSAYHYYTEAEPYLLKANNYYGLTNLYVNMASLLVNKDSIHQAYEYYLLSLRNAELIDTLDRHSRLNRIANATIGLGKYYLRVKSFENALIHFKRAYAIAVKYNSRFQQQQASKGLYESYFNLNQKDSAQHYFELLLFHNDSLLAEKYNERIDQLNYKFEMEKERDIMAKDKALLLAEKTKDRLMYISIAGILFLIAMVTVVVVYLQRLKLQKNELLRKNLRLEYENISSNLEKKNRELTTNVLYLLKKNEFITSMSDKLKEIDSNKVPKIKQLISDLVRELDKNIKRDAWEEFELRFNEVHVDFYNNLNGKHPDLSPKELRLSAFLRLNMSSKEIASITFQTSQSLKVARYRLRKKLGLAQGENLLGYLNQF